jgi:hypothetical protein
MEKAWKDMYSWPGFLVLGLRKFTVWLGLARLFLAPLGILMVLLVALTCPEQGVDVMRMTTDPLSSEPAVPFIHLPRSLWAEMAVLLLALSVWYFARLLAYAYDADLRKTPRVRLHMPRFLGFACFNVLLLAQIRAGLLGFTIPAGGAIVAFFLLGAAHYLVLHRWIRRSLKEWGGTRPGAIWARSAFSIVIVLGLLATGGPFADGGTGDRLNLIIGTVGHLVVQTLFLWYLNMRHWYFKRGDGREEPRQVELAQGGMLMAMTNGIRRLAMGLVNALNRMFQPALAEFGSANRELIKSLHRKSGGPEGDKDGEVLIEQDVGFMSMYIAFALALLSVFIAASVDVDLAMRAGTVAIVTLGLTVLLSLMCIAQLIAKLKGISVMAIAVIIALVTGQFADPHEIHLEPRGLDEKRSFDGRVDLKTYLAAWYGQREQEIREAQGSYPMIFVLADGGASRSGYWVASVLGRLHDSTGCSGHGFERHLFSLSGASGGSVGTGTYFTMLYQERNTGTVCQGMTEQCRRILGRDLLTPALASLLGADVVNLMLPVAELPDRARALERALQVADDDSWDPSAFSEHFSDLVTSKDLREPQNGLPILHINTTRMQDGCPAVISTIDISQPFYNRRVDVLDLVPEDMDMELATAVITGARFPYISPAGSIHSEAHGDHYFVDGGYFDNSGAGITHEMIAQIFSSGKMLDTVVTDTVLRKRIRPYVIHIGNSRLVEPTAGMVSPFANDLAAPVTTMLGAYGMQTDVNDQRLKTMLERLYQDTPCYMDIQLYRDGAERESYPMNWAMSRAVRGRMDQRLDEHEGLKAFVAYIRSGFDEALRPRNQ